MRGQHPRSPTTVCEPALELVLELRSGFLDSATKYNKLWTLREQRGLLFAVRWVKTFKQKTVLYNLSVSWATTTQKSQKLFRQDFFCKPYRRSPVKVWPIRQAKLFRSTDKKLFISAVEVQIDQRRRELLEGSTSMSWKEKLLLLSYPRGITLHTKGGTAARSTRPSLPTQVQTDDDN